MHRNLFPISLDTKLKNFESYVDIQHIERFLYYRRYFLRCLDLHWRATVGDTHPSFSDTTCVYILQARIYTSVFDTQLCLTAKLTYLKSAYYILNDGFTASDASFIKTKLVATLHVAVSFRLFVYAIIKFTIRGIYYLTFLRVCCQATKKRT